MAAQAIFGPPGTGKTRHLIELAKTEASKAQSALFLSFTRAAAAEAVSRLPQAMPVKASTIHSMAFNALNMSRAAVVDRRKLTDFGKVSGFPFMGTETGSDEPQEGDDYATVQAFSNNRQMPIMEAYDRFGCPGTRHRFELFIKSYRDWKKQYGYMDFDDMLMRFADGDGHAPNYNVVFLDEAQDCSPLQWASFRRVSKNAEQIYVAGDDDQAIYEWNGANPHGMVEFVESSKAKRQILGQSYRVPRAVHNLAHNKLLSQIKRRVYKKFDPREANGHVTHYGDFWNIDLQGFNDTGGGLILVRDNWRLKEVQRALNRELVPYEVFGGYSPWTSKIAQALKKGERPEIPLMWREFYQQADLSLPVKVNVSTIHQAKGRESHRVIMDLELSSRVLANLYTDRDAELRVMYVGMTRTSDELILCGSNPLV